MEQEMARSLLLAALFGASVLAVALYALAAAGHFPHHGRAERLRSGLGPLVLWATMAAAGLALGVALLAAVRAVPWPHAVLAACLATLFAPVVLQRFPDSVVDGRRGLLGFAAAALGLAAAAWVLAS